MDNMKPFNCVVGAIYRLPANDRIKPMINLEILENLGHNSIKTKCLDCQAVDTYAKSDLENGKVYLCKNCGKQSVYSTDLVKLTLEKIKDNNNNTVAVCKCEYCKKENIYPLIDLIYGRIRRCNHCIGGLKIGDNVSGATIVRFGANKEGVWGAHLQCNTCGKPAGAFEVSRLLNALESKLSMKGQFKCECAVKAVKQEDKPTKMQAKTRQYKDTDDFTNIKPHNRDNNKVFAECKNCGIASDYTLSDIYRDYEPCKFCKGLLEGDVVASKKIEQNYLSKLKLTDKAKEHIKSMNSKFELVISDMRSMKQDYIDARNARIKYKPAVYCKCNNCNIENRYEADNIDLDIDKCNICDFNILIGTIIGDKNRLTEKIITGMRRESNQTFLDTECTTCGTKISISKLGYGRIALEACPICKFKAENDIDESRSLVGNIFKQYGASSVNGYTKIGKYIVLLKDKDEVRIKIKAQCTECGTIINSTFASIKEFEDIYSDGSCNNCDVLRNSTRNYINNNNWNGYIKNCRIVEKVFEEDGIKKVNIRCLLCDDTVTVPLTVFLYSDYCICEKCRDTKIIMRCPSCKQIHDNGLTLGQLYNDNSDSKIESRITCPVTNKKTAISVYRHYQEEQSRLDFLLTNYLELDDIEKIPGDSGLIRSNSKYYEGTDGEKYYTCYCEKHNKFMTLKEDEMASYEHLYCADTRMFGYF